MRTNFWIPYLFIIQIFKHNCAFILKSPASSVTDNLFFRDNFRAFLLTRILVRSIRSHNKLVSLVADPQRPIRALWGNTDSYAWLLSMTTITPKMASVVYLTGCWLSKLLRLLRVLIPHQHYSTVYGKLQHLKDRSKPVIEGDRQVFIQWNISLKAPALSLSWKSFFFPNPPSPRNLKYRLSTETSSLLLSHKTLQHTAATENTTITMAQWDKK